MDSSATASDINPSAATETVTETNDCVERDAPTDRQADANTDDTDVSKQQGSVPVPKAEDVLPGLRIFEGRASIGVDDVREVIRLLNAADIPACVVDVNALRYYGAGRVTWEWDICVPAHQLGDAERIFKENDDYEPAKPPPPLMKSFRHLNPIFKLKGAGFFFILTPSSRCFIDPRPEYCELSRKGIPYPQMPQFGRSLLVLQNGSNLADFIDGMNLDEAWGEENIDFDDLQPKGIEFMKAQNVELQTRDLGEFNVNVDFRRLWNEVVREKERRIEPMKKGRYKTRWRRIKNDTDPRQRDRPF